MAKKKIEITPVSWVIMYNQFRFMIFGKVSETYNNRTGIDSYEIYGYALEVQSIDWIQKVPVRVDRTFNSIQEVVKYIKENYKI